MTLTFDIQKGQYYWIVETDDAETVVSPEFASEVCVDLTRNSK